MKIDKLLPEHIVGYLPFGISFRLSAIGIFNLDSEYQNPYEAYKSLKLTNLHNGENFEAELEHEGGWGVGLIELEEINPELRKLSSITSEELELFSICFRIWYDKPNFNYNLMIYSDIEMCYKLHIDFRDLIGNDLAIDKETLKD